MAKRGLSNPGRLKTTSKGVSKQFKAGDPAPKANKASALYKGGAPSKKGSKQFGSRTLLGG